MSNASGNATAEAQPGPKFFNSQMDIPIGIIYLLFGIGGMVSNGK